MSSSSSDSDELEFEVEVTQGKAPEQKTELKS